MVCTRIEMDFKWILIWEPSAPPQRAHPCCSGQGVHVEALAKSLTNHLSQVATFCRQRENAVIVVQGGVNKMNFPPSFIQWHPTSYLESLVYIGECWAKWFAVLLTSSGFFQSKHLFLDHTWRSKGGKNWSLCPEVFPAFGLIFLPKCF